MSHYSDDVATGLPEEPRLRIAGRPRAGGAEKLIVLEEPGEPVQIHYVGTNRPHFRRNCPYCAGDDVAIKPAWYLGAATPEGELVILELTRKCYQTCQRDAMNFDERGYRLSEPAAPVFRGLCVKICRSPAERSPRVLVCEGRIVPKLDWPYETRRELARIWGIPVRPRLHKAEGEGA